MIGYNKQNYNCAHHAVKRINEIHGTSFKIDAGQEWQVNFIQYLRKSFTPTRRPVNGCLVVMSQGDDSLHVGVYNDYQVEHNYKPVDGAGCVIYSDMGTIRSEYKRVRFYDVNQKVL